MGCVKGLPGIIGATTIQIHRQQVISGKGIGAEAEFVHERMQLSAEGEGRHRAQERGESEVVG